MFVSLFFLFFFFAQAAPAFSKYTPVEHFPGPDIESDEAMLDSARKISTSIFHPVGTCRMGLDENKSDPTAVVDSELRVRGVRGLRVSDASVMPQITSGNTNSPVVMIAEKTAEEMLKKATHGGR